jgi:hypothetical protein
MPIARPKNAAVGGKIKSDVGREMEIREGDSESVAVGSLERYEEVVEPEVLELGLGLGLEKDMASCQGCLLMVCLNEVLC